MPRRMRRSPGNPLMMNTLGMEVKPAVVSKQAEEVIHGVVTQVVCSAFTDHILVVVTQYGKIGTLVSVTPNMVTGDLERPTLTTKVLLGCDEPVVHVCAKNLVSFVSQESKNKPVLLGLALKDKSVDCVTAVKEVIKRCQVW
ncbi:proteasome assembly chaperone 3 isoform X1 [Engystomops pustulosus]|uniref:proteasome assembly chaperone 3 isoform X1 n=2 Tax=Engystomops pustulosus TaxID=76066 RepID=UPI003AFA6A65